MSDPASRAARQQRLTPERIVLVGLRGSGKSTIGPLLAQLLDLPFLDSDRSIEEAEAHPATIIAEQGLPRFREIERRVVLELAQAESGVLALGGGAVEPPEVILALHPWLALWLDAPDAVLAARLDSDRTLRPALTDRTPLEEIALLRERRSALYSSISPVMIPTGDRDPDSIARAIVENLAEGYASQ